MTVSEGRSRARSWGVQRARARGPVIATLAALVLVSSAVLSGIAGYAALAGREGLQQYLDSTTGTAAALQVRTRLGDQDQAGRARAFFDRELGGLHARVDRSVTVAPLPVTGTTQTLRLGSYDGFAAHARIVAGRWPSPATTATTATTPAGTVPAALPVEAARALGVGVGDTVAVEGAGRYAVVALWRPRAADDPFFTANASADDGQAALARDRTALGVLVVPETALAGLSPSVSWTVTTDARAIRTDDVAPLSRAVAGLPDALDREPDLAPSGVLSAGGLAGTLRTLDRSQQAALAMRPVPVVVVAALAILMLAQLSALLARQRGPETALLRSRGASGRQMARLALVEAAVLAVVPAALGAALTSVALALAGARVPVLGWVLSAAVALVALVAIAGPAVAQTRRTADRQQIDDSGRRVAVTAGATLLAAAVAAGVATWRFRSLGAATFVDAGGTTRVDPIAVLAPGLVLLAGALAASAVFAAGAAVVERAASRRTDLGAVLGARQVARRATTYGVLVILLGIAVGTTMLAAAYAPSQARAQERLDALGNGADVQVTLPPDDPMSPASYDPVLSRLRALDPVAAALPVQDRDVTVGTTEARLLGVSATRLPSVVPAPIASLGDELRPAARAAAGLAVPRGAQEVRLGVRVSGTAGAADDEPPPTEAVLTTSVWVQAPDGSVQVLATGDLDVPLDGRPVERELTAATPGLAAGSRIVAVDATRPRAEAVRLTMQVPALGDGWRVFPGLSDDAGDAVQEVADGWTATTQTGGEVALRLVPASTASRLPVVVDRALARRLDLRRGDPFTLSVDSARGLPSQVVAVVDQLPGAQSRPVVGADLGTLERAVLAQTFSVPAAGAVWLAPRGSAAAAERAVQPLVPATSSVVAASSRSAEGVVAPASVALWLGAAGTLLLALVGAGCVVASAAESRRAELVVLRAVGVGARTQGRWRAAELVGVVLAGTLLGLVVGALATFLTVPGLAGSTLVGDVSGPAPLALAWGALAALVAGLVVLVLVVVAAHARLTTRAALASTPSEVHR